MWRRRCSRRPRRCSLNADSKNIVYFDGYCGVCNRFIDFLIRHDRARALRYAPLQGATARARLPAELVNDLSTIVYEENGKLTTESTAAIRVIAKAGGFLRLMIVFLAVPRFLRDWAYRWVANHRYLFAGRRETCRLPAPQERSLFLD